MDAVASCILINSLTKQIAGVLTQIGTLTPISEINSENFKVLLEETVAYSKVLSNIESISVHIQALKEDNEAAEKFILAYQSSINLLQKLSKDINGEAAQTSGKEKGTALKTRSLKIHQLRQYETTLGSIKELLIEADQCYSMRRFRPLTLPKPDLRQEKLHIDPILSTPTPLTVPTSSSAKQKAYRMNLTALPARVFCAIPLHLYTSAKGTLKGFTRSVQNMWLQYLISVGNACICGSWLKAGSLLHRWARPELSQGKRTFWRCDCGYELFVDEKPSLPSLCRGTQGQIYSLPASDAASQSQQPPELHSQDGGQEQRNTINSQNTLSTSKLKNSRVELDAATETDTSSTSNVMLRERGFLLMCVNTGRFMTKLSQIETTYLGNDYVLFSNLRASYEELRGSPLKPWSLHHPTSARLVRFELVPIKGPGGSFVGGIKAPSLPPPELVLIKKQYRYTPCPIETELDTFLPEIGFWHQFYNPHTCAQLWWITRLPTKLETELKFDPGVQCLGWGIHIEESLNMAMITLLGFAIILASYLISLLWSVIRKDVSSGFGMGSFLISGGALFLAIVTMHQKRVI